MALTDFHGYGNGVRWRLVPAGVEIDGGGVERTRGEPKTVTRVWEAYGDAINSTARAQRVPCALIVACICTESGGKADAIRLEPGYVSDEKTPHKVSPGLMQTLISTARDTLQMSVDRQWLLEPANSILAGTTYMAKQAKLTQLDPPLVGAAYNAGGLYANDGAKNRWKLRQYPIGTGDHCDRFVAFFNDAVFVLANHAKKPTVGIDVLLGDAAPVCRSQDPGPSTPPPVAISFGENARETDVTPYSRNVLEDILRKAKLKRAVISSTARTPAEQARVMFDNCEQRGAAAMKDLYAAAGDKVIDVYVASRRAGKHREDVITDMERKIRELGPTNVSRHASDPHVLNVFDVAPSSIVDKRAFEEAVKGETRVSYFLQPPKDPGYHLEIPQR